VIHPKAKLGPKGMSEIELILAKLIRVSKIFCFSDVLGSSQSQCDEGQCKIETIVERSPRVITFDNLGDDSSPDIHEASPPKRIANVPQSPKQVADVPLPPKRVADVPLLPLLHSELPSPAFAKWLKFPMLVFCR
jgi:hypothetical protein